MTRVVKFAILGETLDSNFTRHLNRFFTEGNFTFVDVGGHNATVFNGDEHDGPDIVLNVAMASDDKGALDMWPNRTCFGYRVDINRFSKSHYNWRLNKIFGKQDNYIPVKAYTKIGNIPQDHGRLLFRTPFGARGRGFGFVPEGKTPEWVFQNVNLARDKDKATRDGVKELEAKGVKINSDSFSHSEEHKDMYRMADVANLEYVELVEDIHSEYRLITNHKGEFKIAIKRQRLASEIGLLMAVGSEAEPKDMILIDDNILRLDLINEKSDLNEARVNYHLHLPPVPELPMHSFDLFVTRGGHWGFFEASCEFGEAAVPTGWVAKEARCYMEVLAKALSPTI